MTTTTKPRRLNKADLLALLRELVDQGLPRDQILEKLLPVLGVGLTEDFMTVAVDAIIAAMAIADEVSRAKMVQARKDFHSRERYATEFDGVAASQAKHIAQLPDEPIRVVRMQALEAEKKRRRAVADQAADSWLQIQRKRLVFDRTRERFPEALSDFADWDIT